MTEGIPPVGAAWGKSSSDKPPHPLVCHQVDTAVVARTLASLLLGPRCLAELRTAFLPLGDADGWIALLCGIHDLGKYSPGFQGLRSDLAAARFGPTATDDVRFVERQRGIRRLDTPHGLITALHVMTMLESWGADVAVAGEIAVALGGHHGYFPSFGQIDQARNEKNNHGGSRWAAWREAMVIDLATALGLPDPRSLPWADVRFDIGAAIGLAALTSVSDWIASDRTNYNTPQEPLDLPTYVQSARLRVGQAIEKAGLERWVPPADTSFSALYPDVEEAYHVQVVVEELTAGLESPTLVVVEAPTGEGKTKAALQVSATLVRRLKLAGVYVGMPTKATSNQVLGEVEKLLTTLQDRTTVRLIHSGAREFLAQRTTEPSDIGQDDPEDCDVAAREWFTRKKSLLTNLGVGTVDQAARAAIRSGHMFVRLAALSNKVVVFDEIHSYDIHLSALLDRLLMWLGRLGVSVVLLSATLPTRRRRELTAAWQAGLLGRLPDDTPAEQVTGSDHYPRVTVVGRDAPVVLGAKTSPLNRDRRVQMVGPVPPDQVVGWLLDRVGEGGCAAVVHNMVRRAEETFRSLDKDLTGRGIAVRLLHGQMTNADRYEREAWLAKSFGPKGNRPHSIVVGTQVLEQSLDLDFDVMLSDLAPIDLLIQRVGRVHRHTREGRGNLVLGITGVVHGSDGPAFPRGLHTVYSPYVLMRTWAVLQNRQEICCPDEVPTLIDQVYGPDDAVNCPPGWEKAWHKAQVTHRELVRRRQSQARTVYLPMPAGPSGSVGLQQLSTQPKSPTWTRSGRRKR
ncbi:CRISPR-associated helicase Cas3' [Solihabitans fulvus]|uniref:CRISPR-associated helicase Cas3 n=1 Tax=Solihabitans fulvus TaxID=1892852 RepID=A0A5B2W4W4_9PSEU|nr:CRISPR-associated helicase Cas3' [Solihabitans fulvus]KAA2246405.1 CRISPR-associated helicase Cas3' [Solihabitans fulvus]